MSLPIIIIVMLLAGVIGGIINCLLPSNTSDSGVRTRKMWVCIILGIGATILVPLFLEIAQSKLMDNIHYSWALQKKDCDCNKVGTDSLTLKVIIQRDTTKRAPGDTVKADTAQSKAKVSSATGDSVAAKDCCVPMKNYFLFAAYCLLAAAAGLRFINGLTDSVLKDREIAVQKKTIEKTKEQLEAEKKAAEEARIAEEIANKAKEEVEKKKEKLVSQARIEAVKEEETLLNTSDIKFVMEEKVLPVIGPVTNADDPQNGRFGGKAENNGRKLNATVEKSKKSKGNYDVTVWVESTDTSKPLTDEVIFYLHDTFRPSVYTIKPDGFTDGKAVDDEIVAYGAFTVGAVTDKGATLLELNLADNITYPKGFRER